MDIDKIFDNKAISGYRKFVYDKMNREGIAMMRIKSHQKASNFGAVTTLQATYEDKSEQNLYTEYFPFSVNNMEQKKILLEQYLNGFDKLFVGELKKYEKKFYQKFNREKFKVLEMHNTDKKFQVFGIFSSGKRVSIYQKTYKQDVDPKIKQEDFLKSYTS